MALVLMHSETLADHDIMFKCFKELGEWSKEEGVEAFEKSAAGFNQFGVKHNDTIKKFGRYPGRNAALGRTNTAEEEELLKSGNTFVEVKH